MIRKIAIAMFLFITAGVIAIMSIAATRPATYHIERSMNTSAPPQRVFTVVNNLHRFPEWSPWQKLDPAMKTSYAGPESGPGAMFAWVGNDQAGEGRMTITESMPANHVAMKLEFRLKGLLVVNNCDGPGGKNNKSPLKGRAFKSQLLRLVQ